MAVNDSLFTAVQSKFISNTTLSALLPGGLWAGEIPERDEDGNIPQPPYAYFSSPTFTSRPTFENEFESANLTFQVYTFGYANCEIAIRELKNTFDYKSLDFDRVYSIGIWPIRWRIYNERIRWKDNQIIHRGEVSYLILVQRNRNLISS